MALSNSGQSVFDNMALSNSVEQSIFDKTARDFGVTYALQQRAWRDRGDGSGIFPGLAAIVEGLSPAQRDQYDAERLQTMQRGSPPGEFLQLAPGQPIPAGWSSMDLGKSGQWIVKSHPSGGNGGFLGFLDNTVGQAFDAAQPLMDAATGLGTKIMQSDKLVPALALGLTGAGLGGYLGGVGGGANTVGTGLELAPGASAGGAMGTGAGITSTALPAAAAGTSAGGGILSKLGGLFGGSSNADALRAAVSAGQLTEAEAAAIAAEGGISLVRGGAGGGILSGLTGMSGNTLGALASGAASLYGANQAANAANDATAETRRQFDIGQANTAPWLNAGKSALTEQQKLMGIGGYSPDNSLVELQKSPGYTYRLDQGRRGLDASSAARGGMGGGKAATGTIDWNQNFASNEYGNRLNQLAGVSGTGQTQANNNFGAGMSYAGDIGNSVLAAGAARQSGILGAGNALSGYLNPQPKQPSFKMVNGQLVYQ